MVKIIDNSVQGLPVIPWARSKPTVIVAHETANDTSVVSGERNYMKNNYSSAFYHFIADEEGFHMFHDPSIGGAWGAGPSMHRYAIHVELIRSKNKRNFKKAYKNYVDGIKWLADKWSIPVTLNKGSDKRGIYTHHYVTKTFGGTTHTDPDSYFARYGKTISGFAKDLGASKPKPKPSKPKPPSKPSEPKKTKWTRKGGKWTGQVLKQGDYGPAVKDLQTRLANVYFYPNKGAKNNGVDSYYGANTKDAVRRYQSVKGLNTDGIAGKKTYASLGGKKTTSKPSKSYPLPGGILRLGDKGNKVKQLQRALNKANFKVGNVDGIYGAKTKDAVTRFQKIYDAHNVDGIYGKRTKSRLSKKI